MWSHSKISVLCALSLLCLGERAIAAEPNETFEDATPVPTGTFSISDSIAPGSAGPDTYLGTLGFFGNVELEDDNSSIYGDERASGISFVSINPGETIDFLVTGFDDPDFSGNHGESGEYEVVVDVYDRFDDYIATLTETRTLQPGFVDPFHFEGDSSWTDGTYDVNIDNTVGSSGGASDVDFFKFAELSAGSSFSAEVVQELVTDFDSILGWFDSDGELIDYDDDDGEGTLSLIEGTVPANGILIFAVTGFDDFDFEGDHEEEGFYTLELTIGDTVLDGDFNQDGTVDAADYVAWRKNNQPSEDYVLWRENFGATSGQGSSGQSEVPEPVTLLALLVSSAFMPAYRTRKSRSAARSLDTVRR
jgi:hypothetical protein